MDSDAVEHQTTLAYAPLVGKAMRSRSKLEWVLIGVVVVLVILVAVFAAGYGHCRVTTKPRPLDFPNLLDSHCKTLNGTWYNQLGSRMVIKHTDDGFLFGTYRTAVERTNGSAGSTHSLIVGASPYDKAGSVFAFSVMWTDGASMTTWAGQCLTCDDKEVLISSWMLKAKVKSCTDKWQSTFIGQDTFTRDEQVQVTDLKSSEPDNSGLDDILKWKPSANLDDIKQASRRCGLDGKWQSETDTELSLTHEHGFILEGKYISKLEHVLDLESSLHSLVYGIGNAMQPGSTVALFVVSLDGLVVTGWTGQCHVCNRDEEQFQTNWLHRKRVATCPDNWKATKYGETDFKRVDLTTG